MKHLITLLLIGMLCPLNAAERPSKFAADPIWVLSGAQNPTFMGTNESRNFVYSNRSGEKRLYVVSRKGGIPNIFYMNANTGAYNESTNMLLYDDALVKGGHFVLNSIALSADNKIVASSMASNLSGDPQRILRVYAWDTDASEARLVLNITNIVTMTSGMLTGANNTRLGDKMTITGNLSDGTAKLYFPNYTLQTTTTNPVSHPTIYVFSMISDGSGGYKFNETPTLIDVPLNSLSLCTCATVSVLSDGSYFWSSIGNLIYYIKGNTAYGPTNGQVVGNQVGALKYIGKVGAAEYVAYYRTDFQCAEIIQIVDGNIVSCSTAAFNARLTEGNTYSNPNGTGDVDVDISTPNPTMYILGTNQGVGAYKVTSIDQPDLTSNMEMIWERPYPKSSMPAFMLMTPSTSTDRYVTRDMTLVNHNGEKVLYLINAYNSHVPALFGIFKMKAATGEIYPDSAMILPATSVLDEGTERLWSAAGSEDGVLLVANAANAGKKFQIYAYDSPSATPVVALSYPVPAGSNLGMYGKISVIGNYKDGAAKLYVTDSTFVGTDGSGVQARVYIFSMKSSGASFVFDESNPKVLQFNVGNSTQIAANPLEPRKAFQNLCVSARKDGSFIWDDTFFNMCEVTSNGAVISRGDGTMLPQRANTARYIGKDAQGKAYAAYYEYKNSRAEVYQYPLGDMLGDGRNVLAHTNSFLYKYIFYWRADNDYNYELPESAEASGGIVVDFEAGGVPVIYMMSQNRGLGAYRLKNVSIIPDGASSIGHLNAGNLAVVFQRGTQLAVSGVEVAELELYSVTGQKMAAVKAAEIAAPGLSGVYILKVKDVAGKVEIHKVFVR